MSCCAPGTEPAAFETNDGNPSASEILLASRTLDNDTYQTDISVPSAHCGNCISTIEKTLSRLDGVVSARLNLSTRRVAIKWKKASPTPPFIQTLAAAGYEASLFTYEDFDDDHLMGKLIRATAVAGFSAMNIMLLSVSVWAGADEETRWAFHLISAALALPAVAYSGRIFFHSAWTAIRSKRTNMDVPISVGILLALALSLFDVFRNGPHAYFDAVTTLIFFLLAGRTLDHRMRRKARAAVLGLAKLMPRGATVVSLDGTRTIRPHNEIEPGELVLVAPGDRIPLDGIIETGEADLDASLVTGETAPTYVTTGQAVVSGLLNLNGSLTIRVTHAEQDSFISGMIRLMEAAEDGRANYRRLADRVAGLYSPLVHSLALIAFVGWIAATGDWHRSLTIAISVLIITCPCALGLAVPMVQVVAARCLFERGIALKDGSALERLAAVDTVVFDKTGTLTLGNPKIAACNFTDKDNRKAIALAAHSRHPVCRAVTKTASPDKPAEVEEIEEFPGLGIQGRIENSLYRLGRQSWAITGTPKPGIPKSSTVLSRDGVAVGFLTLSDEVRPDALETVQTLTGDGYDIEVLSGDSNETVADIAAKLNIPRFRSELTPQAKVDRLLTIERNGNKALMVGDGLNDAPALSAAHVSMAPSSAADIGRSAADLVFFGSNLRAVAEAINLAKAAGHLVRQNLAISIIYNLVAIPAAITGHVTPLLAAIAMSLSSILVVGNALRLPKIRPAKMKTKKQTTRPWHAAEAHQ